MRKLIALVPSFALLACGGGDKPVVDPTTNAQTTTTATASASSTTPTPPSAAGTSAYSFVIGAAGCWLGGSWAEAEGETQKAERKKAVEARCADVSKMLTGSPDKVEQLRALEPAITDSMGARVIEFAKNDHLDAAHTENLVKLVTAVGTAQREALLARRASEKIKGDLDKLSTDKEEDAAREKDSDKLTADEAGIVAQLKPTAALEALMNLQAGDYSHDGKAAHGDRSRRSRARAAQAHEGVRGGKRPAARVRRHAAGGGRGCESEARPRHVARVPHGRREGRESCGPRHCQDPEGARALRVGRHGRWLLGQTEGGAAADAR